MNGDVDVSQLGNGPMNGPIVTSGKDMMAGGDSYQYYNGDPEDMVVVLETTITMEGADNRFGFSVMGGMEEGISPRVDDITPGSPADRADLEVDDEILEVNGQSLETASHAEVIQHIHKCIRSRTISLRVKRRAPGDTNGPDPSSIQEAYVIAVEQQAKERLAKLSALEKVQPVDVSNMPGLERPGDINGTNVNGVLDKNHIYAVLKESYENNNVNGPTTEENGDESDVESVIQTSTAADNDNSRLDSGKIGITAIPTSAIGDNHSHTSSTSSARLNGLGSLRTESDPYINIAGGYHSPPGTKLVTEPPAQKSEVKEDKAPPTDFDKLDNTSNRMNMSSEENIEMEEFVPRELPVDCPPSFVKASGMKNPPPFYAQNENSDDIHSQATLPMNQQARRSKQKMKTEEMVQPQTHLNAGVTVVQANSIRSEDKWKQPQQIPVSSHGEQPVKTVDNKVTKISTREVPFVPEADNAQLLVGEVKGILHTVNTYECEELKNIFRNAHFDSLLLAYDRIVQQDPYIVPPPEMEDEDDDMVSNFTEDSVKVVRIDKTAEPLGATVRNEGDSIVIGRIVRGGAADKSGLLHEGDEILDINGHEMKGKSVNEVCDLMATMTGTLTFLLIPCRDMKQANKENAIVHIRANFDYDPEDDMYIPCRELGLSFQKGDILHVINQEDANWWQAYREGEDDQTLAGLVPSKHFRQQREAMKHTLVDDQEPKKKGRWFCARKKKKKKKVLYNANQNEEYDVEEILTYEEVSLFKPRGNKKRPIVLIGPTNVGRHELRQRLLDNDPDRFAAAIPHTTRSKKSGEVDGKDYYFINKQRFEQDILTGKFVEHGEFEKNIYGTSLEAIRHVVSSGKMCVLNLHPQALKILKNSDLKPYIIFVRPPSLDRLRRMKAQTGENLKDEELRDMIEKGREMEDTHGHYFDYVLINSDLDRAYNELVSEINRIQVEPTWVPVTWLS
ncbi:protein PALS1-like [Saccoglossus kowalevskii]